MLEGSTPTSSPAPAAAVRVGPNKGEKLTTEVTDLLESHSWLSSEQVDII